MRKINFKFIFNNKGFIDIIIGAILGAGLAEGISALTSTPKAPSMPAAPSLTSASDTANTAQTQQRQAALAAGGNTNVTSGTGIVLGSDVQSLTLVGSS